MYIRHSKPTLSLNANVNANNKVNVNPQLLHEKFNFYVFCVLGSETINVFTSSCPDKVPNMC